jgi:trk system potassium uptake protein TrkH
MNFKMIRNIIMKLMMAEGILLILPLIVALIYREQEWKMFLVLAAVLIVGGYLGSDRQFKGNTRIFAREGFFIVGMTWILWSFFGCLVFYFSGVLPSMVDCFFEMVSGFTTTGASVFTSVADVPKSVLFWRSFSHWVGGMGVLVFVMALIPLSKNRSMYIMGAEVPGPVAGKILPKAGATAKTLYLIYFAMTMTLAAILAFGGMPLFDAFCNAFGTAGTGGFAVKDGSIGAYANPFYEIVIAVFMMLFGINFNIYYFLIKRKGKDAVKNTELWTYIAIIVSAVTIITLNIIGMYDSLGHAVRDSFFTVTSIISTTGFGTANFDLWPNLSKMIILLLMVLGGCAGSTGGGIKIARVVIIAKAMRRELKKLVHPRLVQVIKIDGKRVDDKAVSGVFVYMLFYFVIMYVSCLLVAFDGKDLVTTITSVVSCLNNVGPGIGDIVGSVGNYSTMSTLSKLVLTIDMLIGRLEIFPVLLLLAPGMWRLKGVDW